MMKEPHVNLTPRYEIARAFTCSEGSNQITCWWMVYDAANERIVARGIVTVDKGLEVAERESNEAMRQAIETDVCMVKVWPTPTVPIPSATDIIQALLQGTCQATDGCTVEPNGICPHGHPSWLLRLGVAYLGGDAEDAGP